MKPTKMIAKPVLIPNGGRGILMVKCDDDQWYTFRELAKLKGYTSNAYYEQYRRKGWGRMRKGL